MKTLFLLFAVGFLCFSSKPKKTQKIFDVHIYGSNNVATQLKALEQAGVWKAAISTSWDLQNTYREKSKVNLLFGLMLPCPNGKVPYGACRNAMRTDRTGLSPGWFETQIKEGKIDFAERFFWLWERFPNNRGK